MSRNLITFIVVLLVLPISYSLEFDISLSEGWNLISIPLELEDMNITNVLSSIEDNYSLVYYNESYYDPNDVEGSTLLNLTHEIAFWIEMINQDTLELQGNYPDLTIIHLEQGWNMIGFPSKNDIGASLFEPSVIEHMFHFNESWKSFNRNRPDSINTFDKVKRGFGYFVKASTEINITINNTVINEKIIIDDVIITPDDVLGAGVQIQPVIDGDKEVTITVQVTDEDGISDIKNVEMVTPRGVMELSQKNQIDFDTAIYEGSFDMYYYDIPRVYEINITAYDKETNYNISSSFEYIELKSLILDTDVIGFNAVNQNDTANVYGDLDMDTPAPTIKNAGNVIIDVEVSGENLIGQSEIDVSNIQYSFNDQGYYVLRNDLSDYDLDLSVESLIDINFKLTIPENALIGQYSGQFTIIAK